MNKQHLFTKTIMCCATSMSLMHSQAAVSQDSLALEEVVVTAQKRAQTLQEVPVAVAVINNEFIAQKGILDIQGLGDQVPSLSVAKTPFQTIVNIRGMGSGGGTRTFEQSVAMYVDGVYAGRANQFLNPFFDVERVEVVRGPQGVMFGVNAVAGGINIVNKKPGQELEGFISTEYESENESWRTEGAVTLPVSEQLAFRVAARKGFEGGYLENTFTGGDAPETDYEMLRGSVAWHPTDELSVNFAAETSKRDTDGTANQITQLSPLYQSLFPASVEDGKKDFRSSSHPDSPEKTNIDSDNYSLNIEWLLGNHTLTSVTGYSKYNFSQDVAPGAVPIPAGAARAEENFNQTYQELRLASEPGAFIEYIAGLTYYHQENDLYQGIDVALPAVTGNPTDPLVGVRNGLNLESTVYGAFAQLTFNFSDSVRAVVGARYSDVDKKANYVISTGAFNSSLTPGEYTLDPVSFFVLSSPQFGWVQWFDPTDLSTMRPTVIDRKKSSSSVDPSLSFQWDISANLGSYVTIAKATKAGGFNDQEKSGVLPENNFARDEFEYDTEKATNYEAGMKYNQGRLRLNAALFYTKFEDLQVSTFSDNTISTKNAASVISKGLEVDGQFLISEGLEVGGYITLLDSYYDDFPGVGCITGPDPMNPPACDPATTNGAGTDTELATDIESSVYLQKSFMLTGDLEFLLRAQSYYNDGYTLAPDQDPIDYMDSYWKHSLYAELASADREWVISIRGENLTNEVIIAQGGDAGLGAGHQGYTLPGRQLFLNARWNF